MPLDHFRLEANSFFVRIIGIGLDRSGGLLELQLRQSIMREWATFDFQFAMCYSMTIPWTAKLDPCHYMINLIFVDLESLIGTCFYYFCSSHITNYHLFNQF